MTGTEILRHAEKHTEGEIIDELLAIAYINECMLMDLAEDAQVIDSTVITAEKNTWYDLPSDYLELFEIEKDGLDYPYYGRKYGDFYRDDFDIRDFQIVFPEKGTYTIRYYRLPKPISKIEDTPEIHEVFHYPISLYVAARFKAEDWEENPAAQAKMNEYYAYKSKAIERLNKLQTTKAPRRVRMHRGWY